MADYLAAISNALTTDDRFWFRGHENIGFSLTPTALRYSTFGNRTKALDLMADFKRIAAIKLQRPPNPENELEWALIARHYGLPTRLLDWTESATTALYFACQNETVDGIVFILKPVDLNRLTYPTKPHIFDPQQDKDIITTYLKTTGKEFHSGRLPIAINPVWNTERLIMQKGVFTLHGNRFSLDSGIPSLVGLPIRSTSKAQLRKELERVGVDELTLFPELEHSCVHLTRRAGLEVCK